MFTQAQLKARQDAWPSLIYPDLPVCEHRAELLDAIKNHQVVVVAGETGSGKTTQLPKLCLEAGLGLSGLIGHTQPRRLAARTVAVRLAEELQVKLGEQVGYQVRFQDQTSEQSLIKLMTDGILLAETRKDPLLKRYQAIIIDEAHERSLNIDFLLGYLKRLLSKRPDLKLIITSATIDVARFSRHFDDCPVFEVSGRTYPVETYYHPLVTDDPDSADLSLQEGVLSALLQIEQLEKTKHWQHGPRDVLVFLPGEREIRELAHWLRRQQGAGLLKHTDILPLYARLPAAEQQRVFQVQPGRRVILSTNVAETSLTVPGIRYVIDSGLARISRYSHRGGVQRLPVEPISQASANQRAGRCGRLAPGACFRLYAEEDFLGRPEFTQPEIQRTNLSAVILQMLALKLGRIEDFPFVEPPDGRMIRDGFRRLFELGAVNDRHGLTSLGRQLARLPIDPRSGRMLLESAKRGCLREMLVLVAGLQIQDPRERPADQQQAADQAHSQFKDAESDFQALLNLWNDYEIQRQELTQNQLRKLCKKNFLSYMRMREWRDLHRQLKLLCREMGLTENTQPPSYAALHQSLLAGLLSHMGLKQEDRTYLGARNRKFVLHPGSGAGKKKPAWILAAELVETTQLYARWVARVDPGWAEPLAAHLVKRQYAEPHWSKKRAQVVAAETQLLFGLPIVAGRKTDFSRIDPEAAHALFIRSGLVEGGYAIRAAFMQHNLALLDQVQVLEDKARKRDILVDEQCLFDFYAARIPADICSGSSFESWRKQAEKNNPQLLFLQNEDLLARDAQEVTEAAFPDVLQWQGVAWPLSYHFAPGEADDGVTLQVPAAMLSQLPEGRLEWLVPGLLQEKCQALLKGLPKQLRKNFVPLPDYVKAATEALVIADEPLGLALGRCLQRLTGVQVPPEAWASVVLPPHLRMNIRVCDVDGKTLGQGRDLASLRQTFAKQAQAGTLAADSQGIQVSGATDWSFGELPAVLETRQAGVTLQAYPGLVDETTSVAVRLFDTAEKANFVSERGVIRLLRLQLADKQKYLLQKLPQIERMALLFAKLGRREVLIDDWLDASLRLACASLNPAQIRSEPAFNECLALARAQWVAVATQLADQVLAALSARQPVVTQLQGKIDLALAMTLKDIEAQLGQLFYTGFIWDAGEYLQDYPRYMQAIEFRVEKARRDRFKDQQLAQTLRAFMERWQARYQPLKESGQVTPALWQYRWLIEELRVSFFAQQLGTRVKVSERRLEDTWQQLISH